jgi:hypothetical protein
MNTSEIRILTERFFNGESTLEEEKRLKAIFSKGDTPKELLPLRDQFLFMASMKVEKIRDDSFDKSLKARINEESAVIPISKRKRILWFGSIAAGILVIITLFFQLNRVAVKVEDTYSNPETAYYQTKKILMYVSNKLNKGTEDLAKVEKLENGFDALQPVDKINKGFEEAGKIKKYDQLENVLTIN